MKGKGKNMADKDCPLQFPDLKPVDHTRQCLRYSTVLEDGEKDSIGLEDLDVIQTDLETLLAAAGKRLKLLGSELQILVSWQEKKDKKGGKVQPESTTPGKRGKQGSEEKHNKKVKVSNDKGSSTPQPPGRPPKTKNVQRSLPLQSKPTDNDYADQVADLPKLPKNDAVDRFWASVEPYCADITSDDIKLLEELLKSHEDDSDYYKIPPLGRHYSEKWAQEDLLEEQKEGSKICDRRRSQNNNTSLSATEAANMLKKAEASYSEDSPFGPLTQRLVSALIEENVMTAFDDSMAEVNPESVEEACSMSPRALAKQLNIGNPALLEKRIKRELEEQGILESDDKVEDNPDDEILTELKEKQQELRSVNQHNIAVTKHLLKLANEEMARKELRKKLTAVEAEVMEAYRKIQASKQKKKAPTKKEKEAAWRALKERETLIKTLEG